MKVIFSFFVNEHIILSMKGGDARNTYLLTEHKNCNFQGKKKSFMFLDETIISFQSDWRCI